MERQLCLHACRYVSMYVCGVSVALESALKRFEGLIRSGVGILYVLYLNVYIRITMGGETRGGSRVYYYTRE